MPGRGEQGGEGAQADAATTVIGVADVIEGKLKIAGGLRVDGRIVGNVRCRTIEQSATGDIGGDIQATDVRVAGAVAGNIHAKSVTIEATARICGEIVYERLSIAPGAQVEGTLTFQTEATQREVAAANEHAAPAESERSSVAKLFPAAAE